MFQQRHKQQRKFSRFHKLVCLTSSTLAFTIYHAKCEALTQTNTFEVFTDVSSLSSLSSSNHLPSPYTTSAPPNAAIAQGFDLPGASPSSGVSPALIWLPGITPVREVLENINPVFSSPAPAPALESAPLPPPYGNSNPDEVIPAPRPFSLKDVRQSVDIALPSEEELLSLTELPFNKMHPGVVGQADPAVDGRRVDFYQFKGEANQQIVVVLRNSDDARQHGLPLYPYMMVFDPTGKVMAGTIIPGQYRVQTTDPLLPLDNQLALRLPQSGRYVVAVFTEPGGVGRYGIGWKQDETRYRYDEIHQLTDVESSVPAEITGRAGQVVRVRAMSYQFDPVVRVVDANGNTIAEDDDDGGNYNARIDVTLPADGAYQAIVTSVDGQGRGEYRLRMR